MTDSHDEQDEEIPTGEEREEIAQQGRIAQTEQEEDDGPAAA